MANKGRITLPVQENMDEELIALIERWGADAIRNSDGTQLSPALAAYVDKVYANFFPVRQDAEYARAHPEQLQQMYVMSKFRVAEGSELTIGLMDGYFAKQLEVDTRHDPAQWWEVIDRTTGEVVPAGDWRFDEASQSVTLTGAKPWHSYTVSFLVYQKWDPTHMYNTVTNNWTDVPPDMPYNPMIPATKERMLAFFEGWLKANPDVSVVRFTTFFYHFTLVYSDLARPKFVEWFGYGQSVSVEMLEAFAAEAGYRLRPEDLVDEGYYNTTFRVPKPAYLAYMDFVQRFVARTAAEVVALAHRYGKEAMMFLGDNYIGTEPYGKYFGQIGLDAVVGSVGNGATLRMIADIPHVRYTEGRFLPYFFPDTFREGGDPLGEANTNWLQARRAMLRHNVDRIGYGGYPALALQFPEFVARVAEIADEFRLMHTNTGNTKPYAAPFKVLVLNSWGSLRTWQTHMVSHGEPYKEIAAHYGVLEALSGMAVNVEFISFADIERDGIPEGAGVILNVGAADTAFSGGHWWGNETVVARVKEWIHRGGGFIGIGEPTAHQHQGRFFQLADVLGVDKERGFSLSTMKYNAPLQGKHFITDDALGAPDFGEYCDNVYRVEPQAENLIIKSGCTQLAVNGFGKGRGVYIAGLPYSPENTRLLLRAIYWAAGREDALHTWFSDNLHTECAAYPERGCYCVVNNTQRPQTTTVYGQGGKIGTLALAPMEIRWEKI